MGVRRAVLLLVVPLLAVPGVGAAVPPAALQAGPAVSYSDQAHDAFQVTPPDGEPMPSPVANPVLSDEAFDLRQVDWAPQTGKRKRDRGYSTAVTITGTPRTDGSYVSYGHFTHGGETCQLYHFLTPGITAFANAFCGTIEDGDRVFLGRVQGSAVTTTPTPAGTVLAAVFDNSRLPAELQDAGSTLHDLRAFTCVQGDEGLGCRSYEVLDAAVSELSYRLA